MTTNITNQAPTQTENKDGRIKTFPSPKQLATPTDLKPEGVQAVTELEIHLG